jgi:hypothetical protein
MGDQVIRKRPARRRQPRVLLVGLTRLMMRALEGPLSEAAQVSAVPFPSTAFERAAADLRPDLVVVDVTYLSEERVRPLIMERFEATGAVVVFTSEAGGGWMDDLGSRCSHPLASHAPDALLSLIAPPALRIVPC